MITSLQNFISSKGKFVFVLLLILVVVSFVLYLSQGSSVFDLFPDPNHQRKEFYGYDWNDPDQRRYLNVASRVSADFGAVVSPSREILNQAEDEYMAGLQKRMQAAFQANQEEVDREALQQMFSYMQAWPNFPNDMKAREIAMSGNYGQDFLQSVIESKVALAGQADNWQFMPLNLNHPAINSRFNEFLIGLAPGMNQEENRTRALSFVGSRHGVSGRDAESILYDSFRTRQVERVFLDGGYALEEEAKIDLHANQFAWDGEVAELHVDDLSFEQPAWAVLEIKTLPKINESLAIDYGAKKRKFVYSASPMEGNASLRYVPLGKNLSQFRKNLKSAIDKEDFGFESKTKGEGILAMFPLPNRLPQKMPMVKSNSAAIKSGESLDERLREFHRDRTNDEPFAEPPRTLATAAIFLSADFMVEPSLPDEARLRSYYDRNQLDFVKSLPVEDTNDGNQTDGSVQTVSQSFEEAKPEILKRVTAQDKEDARKDADLLARDAALDFLDKLNGFRDKVGSQYSSYPAFRNSDEFSSLIDQAGAKVQKISFSKNEMGTQAMVLGLERRESERRANREPLEEVAGLNERLFFTRSVRKSRQGYIVFILDNKTEKQPGTYEGATFADLYKGYTAEAARTYFSDQVDGALVNLQSDDQKRKPSKKLRRFKVSAKTPGLARAGFDAEQRRIRSNIQKAEDEQKLLGSLDGNSSKDDVRIKKLDNDIAALREKLDQANQERTAIMRLLESASTLTVDGKWQELERNEERAVFVRLTQAYLMRNKESTKEEISQRRTILESNRGQDTRDSIVEDLVAVGLGSSR